MTLPPPTGARTRGDVLITGATGFLGMELLARLLGDGDRRVWALVRASGQAEAEARVRATLASLVPDAESVAGRVVPVAGDLLRDGLGIEQGLRDELAEAVDEVIHGGLGLLLAAPRPGPGGERGGRPARARAGDVRRLPRRRAAPLRARVDRVRGRHAQRCVPRVGSRSWAGLPQHLRALQVGGRTDGAPP